MLHTQAERPTPTANASVTLWLVTTLNGDPVPPPLCQPFTTHEMIRRTARGGFYDPEDGTVLNWGYDTK
jgi:hypothetical protein